MSSDQIIKSVSKKLKHYFELKRLEESFDLSGPYNPILDHPPIRQTTLIQYPNLCDRSLKKYFSHPEVRVRLTQLKPQDNSQKKVKSDEERVKKRIQHLMKTYSYKVDPQIPQLPYTCYYRTKSGLKLKPEFRNPYSTTKARPFTGAYPILRQVPSSNISKGEAERLVNAATRLLASTENIDLGCSRYRTTSTGTKLQSLSNTKKTKRKGKSATPSTISISKSEDSLYEKEESDHEEEEENDDDYDDIDKDSLENINAEIPAWLQKEMKKQNEIDSINDQKRFVHHLNIDDQPKDRPMSAKGHRTLPSITHTETQSTQTDNFLLENYDVTSQLVEDGPIVEYHLYVTTGNVLGASTRVPVFITLFGSNGCSKEILLTDCLNNKIPFRKGETDRFNIQTLDIGDIKRICIGHNSSEAGSDWFLSKVIILDIEKKTQYLFRCDKWLSFKDQPKVILLASSVDATSELKETQTRNLHDADTVDSCNMQTTLRDVEAMSSSSNDAVEKNMNVRSSTNDADESNMARLHDARSSVSFNLSDEQIPDPKIVSVEEDEVPDSDSECSTNSVTEDSDEDSENSYSGTDADITESTNQPISHSSTAPDTTDSNESNTVRLKPEDMSYAELDARLLNGKSIHSAAQDGDIERLVELISASSSQIELVDERGYTALHCAAAFGQNVALKWLSSKGALINAETRTGYHAIHLAALEGHLDCLMTLCSLGVNVNDQSADGMTALHCAAKNGHTTLVRWLLSNKVDLEMRDLSDKTALSWAKQYNHLETVVLLREKMRPSATTLDEQVSSDPLPVKVLPKSVQRKSSQDESVEKRRQEYERQQKLMQRSNASFLDFVRNEVDAE